MSVLIKGMEMPKEPDEMIEIVIFGDGRTLQTGESWRSLEDGKCYYTTSNNDEVYESIEVPDGHGRLIDADALQKSVPNFGFGYRSIMQGVIGVAPTVIPASGKESQS